MIIIRNLSYRYGNETALKEINLTIPSNTTCSIIGPSGCGKTTLLYSIAGLLTPGSGEIQVKGEIISGIRRDIGLILQNLGLLPWKTVWENVALGLKARKIDKGIMNIRVQHMLEELNILEHKGKYPDQLSGGQRQRVAIARTLVTEPDILLLDEASSALDAITRESIQDLILKLYKKRPVTTVVVTHSIEEAVFLGQKIIIMKNSGIRHIIENPYFGDENIRLKEEYFNICREVRKWLYEGDRS